MKEAWYHQDTSDRAHPLATTLSISPQIAPYLNLAIRGDRAHTPPPPDRAHSSPPPCMTPCTHRIALSSVREKRAARSESGRRSVCDESTRRCSGRAVEVRVSRLGWEKAKYGLGEVDDESEAKARRGEARWKNNRDWKWNRYLAGGSRPKYDRRRSPLEGRRRVQTERCSTWSLEARDRDICEERCHVRPVLHLRWASPKKRIEARL